MLVAYAQEIDRFGASIGRFLSNLRATFITRQDKPVLAFEASSRLITFTIKLYVAMLLFQAETLREHPSSIAVGMSFLG